MPPCVSESVLIRSIPRRVALCPGFTGLFVLPILIGAPPADGGDDQNRDGNDQPVVAVPQLLELFPADLLVDFVKKLRHLGVHTEASSKLSQAALAGAS